MQSVGDILKLTIISNISTRQIRHPFAQLPILNQSLLLITHFFSLLFLPLTLLCCYSLLQLCTTHFIFSLIGLEFSALTSSFKAKHQKVIIFNQKKSWNLPE